MTKYIDADKLLKLLNAWKYPVNKTTRREITYNASISDACRCVNAMPAADVVEVRHGRWLKERVLSTGSGSYGVYQCSICGAMFHDIGYGYNYCPNCGSRMDLDGDTE